MQHSDDEQLPDELTDDARQPAAEDAVRSLQGRVMAMSVPEKVKLATMGNREARGLLIRDANRTVVQAVLDSPRLTEEEVVAFAANRNLPADVPRMIAEKKEYLRHYAVRVALVNNAKTPVPTALKLLDAIREHDLKGIAKNRNIPSVVSQAAQRALARRNTRRG